LRLERVTSILCTSLAHLRPRSSVLGPHLLPSVQHLNVDLVYMPALAAERDIKEVLAVRCLFPRPVFHAQQVLLGSDVLLRWNGSCSFV
jgi:hypothetical protein